MKELPKERFAVFLKEKGFSPSSIERYLLQIQIFEIWQIIENLDQNQLQIDHFRIWLILEELDQKLKQSVQEKLTQKIGTPFS